MRERHGLAGILANATNGVDLNTPERLFVAGLNLGDVRYGCNPWTPERDIDYRDQHPETGAWTPPTAKYNRRDLCPWCLGRPAAAGRMCPGCHRFASAADELKLKAQRKRSRGYAQAGTPLETPPDEPPQGPAPQRAGPRRPLPRRASAQATPEGTSRRRGLPPLLLPDRRAPAPEGKGP